MSCCEKTDCMQLWSRVSENTVMSWFDEQIRARKESDEAGFSEANRSLGNIINGKHFGVHRRETTGDPISDILLYYPMGPNEDIHLTMRHSLYDLLLFSWRNES